MRPIGRKEDGEKRKRLLYLTLPPIWYADGLTHLHLHLSYPTYLLLTTFLTYLTTGYLILQGYTIAAVILGWNIWPSFWTYLQKCVL